MVLVVLFALAGVLLGEVVVGARRARRAVRAHLRDERGDGEDEGVIRVAIIVMLAVIIVIAIRNGLL